MSEAVAGLALDAEDAGQVHVALDRGPHGAQLDARRVATVATPAVRHPARPARTISTGRHAAIGGREDLRVVRVEGERLVVRLLGADAAEVLDGGAGVDSIDPGRRRTPLELGQLRHVGHRVTSAEQRCDVDAVVDGG